MPDSECLICSMEGADPASRVFLDELWAAEVAPGYEVPGWFFLRARRHAEKLTGLDEAETATFGRHAHDLVSALEQVTGAPAVYMLSFALRYRAVPGGHGTRRVRIVTPPCGRPPARAAVRIQKCVHILSWISLASRSRL
jgi:hypothetical protein